MKHDQLTYGGTRSIAKWVWLTLILALGLVMTMMSPLPPARAEHAGVGDNSGHVVMLDTTDTGFGSGRLESSFVAAGKTVVKKTPADWLLMTTADFASYDAIVLADPTCQTGGETGAIAAAVASAATWGAAADGNVIIIGTDEQFHFNSGGQTLMDGAAEFVVADADKTGAYVSLSCYFHGAAPGTPVTALGNAFGGAFTVTGVPGCFDNAHIVATHAAFTTAGVTDATLSGWGCSVHEAFDSWPINFEVLAIALTGTVFTAPDGTVGTPYILARGVEVISDIDLSPEEALNPIGTEHTVTAVVTTDDPVPGTPVVGTPVTFEVIAGPHVGVVGVALTDAVGVATFTYVGVAVGIDTIEATFVDELGRTQRSNRVTKEWEVPRNPVVDKWWSHTNVCFERDNDGDGSFGEDPVDFDAAGNPIDNDEDGLFNEDGLDCDPASLGTPLDRGDDTFTVDAVVGKKGNVKNYNPGQAYAVTRIEVPIDGTLTIHEEYGACTADLLELNPKKGGGRLVIVSEHDGTLEQILDAKDIEDAGGTVDSDGAWFDLDVEAGDILYVYVKFRPSDADVGSSCTNTTSASIDEGPSGSDSADLTVIEKVR